MSTLHLVWKTVSALDIIFLMINFVDMLIFQTRYMMTVNEALAVCYPEVSVKFAIGIALFSNTLSTLGTERHAHILQSVWNRKVKTVLKIT